MNTMTEFPYQTLKPGIPIPIIVKEDQRRGTSR